VPTHALSRQVESLAIFAAKRGQGGRTCTTCHTISAGVRAEIAKTKEAQPTISWPTISAWLTEKRGITIKPNALRNHFVAGHDKEAS